MTSGPVAMALGAGALAWLLVIVMRRGHTPTPGRAYGVAVACALAWVANLVVTSRAFVDILWLDAWEQVALVEHLRGGTFRLAELFAAHNEHRPLTGRVVALACAQLTSWNHWWEFGALHAVAACLVVTLVWYGARPGGAWHTTPLALAAAVSCLVSTMHWDTWLRGFSVHILMGVLAPAVALLWLSHGRPGWGTLVGAMLATIVGELSFGAALLIWPIGAVVILVRRSVDWPRHLAVWLVIGLTATLWYLPGLQVHPGATANSDVAFGPAGLARMIVGLFVTVAMAGVYVPSVFEGGPAWAQVAVVVGAGLAVLSWAVTIGTRWRDDATRDLAWLFPAALGAFGLGACLLVSAGRVAGGLVALTASRYLIFAACFWASWVLLIGLRPTVGAPRRRGAIGAAVALMGAMALNSIAAIPYMEAEADRVREARRLFLVGDVGAAAHALYPDPYKLEHMREVLRAQGLSVFRPGAR